MPVNLTLDDSSSGIDYSSEWATQGNEPGTSNFFQSTYHAAEANVSTVNFTFTGYSVYVFGSKGPNHASYIIQFDDAEQFFSANASTMQFQQPLFTHTFNSTSPALHFVQMTALFSEDANWLDLDYITITVDDGQDGISAGSGFGVGAAAKIPATITPPWLISTSSSSTSATVSSSSSTASTVPSSAQPSSQPTSQFSNSKITLALSALFGTLLGLVLLLLLIYFFLRRRYKKRLQQLPEFQYASQNAYANISTPDTIPSFAISPDTPNMESRFSVSIRDFPTPPLSPFSQAFASITSYTHTRTHSRSESPNAPSTDSPSTRTSVTNASSGMRTLLLPSRLKRGSAAFSLDPLQEQSEKSLHSASVAQSPIVLAPPPQPSRPRPLPPPPPPPPRPKRPPGNVLGWISSASNALSFDSSSSPKSRHTGDANSMKTDFLQLTE